jgi:predicted PhzF superfamily epimerase YddE/YHI9
MQRVAAELNQAATAFLTPNDEPYWLHWFSPRTELSLCCHGTLGQHTSSGSTSASRPTNSPSRRRPGR